MSDVDREIDAALAAKGTISRDDVVRWIGAATNLTTLSNLYRLTGESYWRIEPELGQETACGLIQGYLLECIKQDAPDGNDVQGRWQAAGTLHMWFCHLLGMKETSAVLRKAAKAITEVFLASGSEIQAAIEQGFLEHAREMVDLRPYFEHWASDDRLRPAWTRALEWGKAHPNFTWGLLQQLRGDKK